MPPARRPDSARAYRTSTLTAYSVVVERVIRAMRAQVSEPPSLDEMAEIASLLPPLLATLAASKARIPV